MAQVTDGRTVLRAVITESTGASNEQVAAVAGSKIVVVQAMFICSVANVITWQTAANALSGAMSFGANGGYRDSDSSVGLFQTVEGEALNMLSGSAQQVSGYLSYVLVS